MAVGDGEVPLVIRNGCNPANAARMVDAVRQAEPLKLALRPFGRFGQQSRRVLELLLHPGRHHRKLLFQWLVECVQFSLEAVNVGLPRLYRVEERCSARAALNRVHEIRQALPRVAKSIFCASPKPGPLIDCVIQTSGEGVGDVLHGFWPEHFGPQARQQGRIIEIPFSSDRSSDRR
jgi:hypothetical protein